MSKRLALVNIEHKPGFKERINKDKDFIPKWMKDDPDFRFGKPAYLPGNQRITPVINNEFLKDFLSTNIKNKAHENMQMQRLLNKEKKWQNRSFKLRSQSVAQ